MTIVVTVSAATLAFMLRPYRLGAITTGISLMVYLARPEWVTFAAVAAYTGVMVAWDCAVWGTG